MKAIMQCALFIASILVFGVPGANAQSGNASAQGLVNQWHEENSSCRGSSGVDPDTFPACLNRQKIDEQLTSMGYCYGREGEGGYQSEWHRCGPSSLKSVPQTAKQQEPIGQSISDKWAALTSTCRSDPPAWQSTRQACEERNALAIQLDAAGLCYVNPPGHWQKCGTQQRNPTGPIAQTLIAGPLKNSNLSAVSVAPSTAAKAVDDWRVKTIEDFWKFFERNTKESEKNDPLKPLTNLLGLLGGGGGGNELIWTWAFQYGSNPTVKWYFDTFDGDKNEVGDDTWVHRCINVETRSFPKSAKIKRRLNGSFAPEQFVALRIVTVFGLEAGAVDKLERKDLDSKLTAVTGSQHAKVFFMAGKTNDKNEIVFSNVRSADGTDRSADIKTLIVPKSISNGALERTLSNLQKDCPNKWE